MATVHVVPVGDTVGHTVPGGLPAGFPPGGWLTIEAVGDDEDCVCGPRVEHLPHEDGPDGWLVVHHSLDGRETRQRVIHREDA